MYFQIELHVEVGGAIAEMSVGSIAFKKVKGRRQNPIIVCFKEISWPHLSIQSSGREDFCILSIYPFLAFLQLVYSLQDVIVDIEKKILPLWFCERSRLILSGCLVSASSHISSVHFAPPFLMRHCGLG